MSVLITRRLWLTADRERVVEEGDPSAAFLLAAEGDEVSDEDAERYGVEAVLLAEVKAVASAEVEDKAADRAPTKGRG